MSIAEAIKIKTAAKAYMGGLALAAQVALTFLPDHGGYFNAVQVLLAVLGLIGIYAAPNKAAAAKQGVVSIVDQLGALLLQLQASAPNITPDPAVLASVDHAKFTPQFGVSAPLAEPSTSTNGVPEQTVKLPDVKPEGLPSVLPLGNTDGINVLRTAAEAAPEPAPAEAAPQAAPAPAETPATPPAAGA